MANWEDENDAEVNKALLRGGVQGATLGLRDEIGGGWDALGAILENLKGGDRNISDVYTQSRDESRALDAAAKKVQPEAFELSELGGGMIPGLASGGIGALSKLSALKAAIAAGGLEGALNGFGHGEGDSMGQLSDTALGLVKGVGGSLFGHGLGAGLKGLLGRLGPKGLPEVAGEMRFPLPKGADPKIVAEVPAINLGPDGFPRDPNWRSTIPKDHPFWRRFQEPANPLPPIDEAADAAKISALDKMMEEPVSKRTNSMRSPVDERTDVPLGAPEDDTWRRR